MPSIISIASAAAFLLPAAQAHMLLSYPQPFAVSDVPDNGPLTTAESSSGTPNYPCKARSAADYDFSFQRTAMPLGSNQTLTFKGSAVHGGGSCQISLSKDKAPTAGSDFRVIHSIIGGCPARNTPGNLGDNASMQDPDTYDVTIPDDLEPGDYTFAWTWFNKVGNREFYMNCAPITLTGGSTKRDITARADAFDSLPHMFVGNIPGVPKVCATDSIVGSNLEYENPGTSVERNNPSDSFKKISGDLSGCYAPLGGSGGAGPAGKSPSPQGASGADAGSSSSIDPASTPTATDASGSSPSSTPSATPVASPVALPDASTPMAGTGACAAGSVPCSAPGFQCIDSTHFGLCANGCMISQSVAAGTVCVNNGIAAASKLRRRARAVPPQARGAHSYYLNNDLDFEF